MRAQSFEPLRDAGRQRGADRADESLRRRRRRFWVGELSDGGPAAVGDPALQRVDRVRERRRGIEGEAHHRLVIAHQRDRHLGANPFSRANRQIDRAERIRAAVNEVAEKHDGAAQRAARLALRFLEQSVEQIGAPVNVADGENLDLGRGRARQGEELAVDDDGHGRVLGPAAGAAAAFLRLGEVCGQPPRPLTLPLPAKTRGEGKNGAARAPLPRSGERQGEGPGDWPRPRQICKPAKLERTRRRRHYRAQERRFPGVPSPSPMRAVAP